jgi:hypothetical protein
MASPGMATGDSPERKPCPFQQTMLSQGFRGILRTGGGITALGSEERGNTPLIDPDESNEGQAQDTQYMPHFISLINFCKATPILPDTVP